MASSLSELLLLQDLPTDPENAIPIYRKFVIGCVNEIFSDISKATKSNLREQLLTSLDFLLNAVVQFPILFIPPLPSFAADQHADVSNEEQKLQQDPAYELMCWVLAHILRILSISPFKDVQTNAQSFVKELLQIANCQNHFCFASLSNKFLCCLEDLSQFYVQFFGETGRNFGASLDHFSLSVPPGVSTENVAAAQGIDIKSSEQCERLQTAITKIFSEITFQLSFYQGQVERLWKIVNCQLENGEVDLKSASLQLSGQLVKLTLPDSELLEHYCDCQVALTSLLCSGFNECDGDFIELELQLAKTLTQLVTVIDNATVQDLDRVTVLYLLHSNFLNMLIANGMKHLRTLDLRSAICHCLTRSMRLLPSEVVSFSALSDVYGEGLCRQMLNELGQVSDSQHIVLLLREAVLLEFAEQCIDQVGSISGTYCRAVVEAVDCQLGCNDGEQTTQLADKIPKSQAETTQSSQSSGGTFLAEKSSIVAMCVEYLNNLSSSVLEKNCQNMVELSSVVRRQHILLKLLADCLVIHSRMCRYSKSHQSSQSAAVRMLHVDQLRQVVSSWMNLLTQSHSDRTLPDLLQAYDDIVMAIGALIYIQDLEKFSSDLVHILSAFVSLPWLTTDVSWLDLKVPDQRQFLAVSELLWEKISCSTIKECVRVLSLVNRRCAPQWRLFILKKAFTDVREDVRAAAVLNLPYFLHRLGSRAHSVLPEFVHGSLLDASESVTDALASSLGSFVCVASGSTKLVRSVFEEDNRLYHPMFRFKCMICTRSRRGDGDVVPPKLDLSVFKKFAQLLSSSRSSIRLSLIGSFGQLFSHLWTWKNEELSLELLGSALGLLQDPEYDVRLAFSKVVRYLVVCESGLMTKVNEVIISNLSALDKRVASDPSSLELVETMLLTVGEVGRVAEGDLLLKAITILLNVVIFPVSMLMESIALQQLKMVANQKNVLMKHLFLQFGDQICEALVDCLHETKKMKPDWDPSDVLRKVADVFVFADVQTFLKHTENLLLPHLVRKASPTASQLLKNLSRLMDDPNHKNAIIRTIGQIFCHLICSIEQQSELAKVLRYLEAETDWSLSKLLSCGSNIESLLLMRLHPNYDQVLNGLKICLNAKGKFQILGSDVCTNEQLADLLQPILLGALVHFDKNLNDGTVPLDEKKKLLKSFILMMKFMGSQHITRIRVRVMTTLKISLKFKDKGFVELCCEAWSCYVNLLELPTLGPLLCQIVVSLLPLLQALPTQVAAIFQYLIVRNREGLHEHLHELYFIPDIPELSQVNTVLKQYIEGKYSCKDLRTQIEHLLKGITHESLNVRQIALVRMKQLLKTNKVAFHDMVLGSETADPIISQIITTLIQGCREFDPVARNLIGECLGELGAVDPGRLELCVNRPKEESSRILSSVMDEGFALQLINELAKAFLRADDRTVQDCVAFALQELVKVYDIRIDSVSSSTGGAKLWRQFSVDVQEVLSPLIHSMYKLNISLASSGLERPIYRSRKGSTFDMWICTLASYLESRVKQEPCKKVFEVCRGAIMKDSHIALFLLPHLVLQVLLGCDLDDQNMLLQEVNTILVDAKEDEVRHGSPSDLRHRSAQTIFSVLDYLTKWIRHFFAQMLQVQAQGKTEKQPSPEEQHRVKELRGFTERVPQDLLAVASYNCGSYSRAIMHHEQFMKSSGKSSSVQENLDFLLKLYLALDEPDGVAGVISIQQSQPSLAQQILAFESVGQLSDASVCYDLAIQCDPNDVTYRQGLLRNRLALGELNSALNLANGMITENPSWTTQLNMYRVEASWKLGQWDKLELYLESEEDSRDWNIGLGKVFFAAKSKDEKSLHENLAQLRQEQMAPLSAASMEIGSYHRGYEYVVRLHMLKELEEGLKIALGMMTSSSMNQGSILSRDSSILNQPQDENVELSAMIQQWRGRLECSQASYRTRSPILDLERVILTLVKEERGFQTDNEIGNCWLESARVARKCDLLQTAHSLLLSAADYKLHEFWPEKAKWLWKKGEFDQARSSLEKAIDQLYPDRNKFRSALVMEVPQAERIAYAKALLQLNRYNEETASCDSSIIMRQFKEVSSIYNEWEDGYFYTARYYDKVMKSMIDGERSDKRIELISHVINNFGLSLSYGNQYIYQSMPRMLTLWLDFGAEVMAVDNKPEATKQNMRMALASMNKNMQKFCKRLAPYQFLVCFPQLTSRICHTQPDVFAQLKEIIANLLKEFPQQAMWMMMAVSKSTYQMRVKRCQDIFNKAKALRPDLTKFLQDATRLTDRLLDLCNYKVESAATMTLSISQHFKTLQRLLEDPDLSSITLPLQSQMVPVLPNMPVSPSQHVPFSTNQIFIRGIDDGVEILASLQKPKKITLRGSDGKPYIMLCKPKDDLRKDARLMEFTGFVNRCLKRDADSRKRGLHIRTFTVTPLNEECGLLEWVSDVHGLRPILLKLYRERGVYMSGKDLKGFLLAPNAPFEKKLQIYKTKLLPRHQPIFSEWFLRTFPDPTSWYNARLAYCRTAAVMSMVGYILGLGDRHGENILIDSTIGDCLHVDFNCLFNKGETFDYPEIVPFRLTHNMVEAMGPLGYEGIFRKSCEVTLRVMRDQKDPLMSVLTTFIYDPLVEWGKPVRGRSSATDSGEIRNEKAQTHVNNIEDRLRGIHKTKNFHYGLPLSVEGHVSQLIKESTDESNLCQMYIGWASYL